MLGCARICAVVSRYVQVCVGVCKYTQACTGVQGCGQKWLGVCECVWDEFSEYLLENSLYQGLPQPFGCLLLPIDIIKLVIFFLRRSQI